MLPQLDATAPPPAYLLRCSLHEELLAQQWSQAEIAAFYNSPLPDLIVEIAGATLHKLDALPPDDMCCSFTAGVFNEQRTL